MSPEMIFFIVILIFSVIIHEISHGYVAEMLGDPTARMAGRLTLNPIPHIDMVGSFILPVLLIATNAGFVFGWAKPVPYNPYNLKNQKWGPALVAVAGPLSNLVIALIFGLVIRFSGFSFYELLSAPFFNILIMVVGLNLVLAVFNMIPIPPLDGSKVLSAFLPYRYLRTFESVGGYGFFLVLAVVIFVPQVIYIPLSIFFAIITGQPVSLFASVM